MLLNFALVQVGLTHRTWEGLWGFFVFFTPCLGRLATVPRGVLQDVLVLNMFYMSG